SLPSKESLRCLCRCPDRNCEDPAADPRLSRHRHRGGPLRRLAEPLEARLDRGPSVRGRVAHPTHSRDRVVSEPTTAANRSFRLAAPRLVRRGRGGGRADRLLLRARADDRFELRAALEQRGLVHDPLRIRVPRGARPSQRRAPGGPVRHLARLAPPRRERGRHVLRPVLLCLPDDRGDADGSDPADIGPVGHLGRLLLLPERDPQRSSGRRRGPDGRVPRGLLPLSRANGDAGRRRNVETRSLGWSGFAVTPTTPEEAPFARLADLTPKLEATTKRLEKRALLAAFLR